MCKRSSLRSLQLSLCALGFLSACTRGCSPAAQTPGEQGQGGQLVQQHVLFAPLEHLEDCEFAHQGLLLEPEADETHGSKDSTLERGRVAPGPLSLPFRMFAEDITSGGGGDAFLQIKVRGHNAQFVHGVLDGLSLGYTPFPHTSPSLLTLHAKRPLLPGAHTLTLQLLGQPHERTDIPPASFQWVHVTDRLPDPLYTAPTRANAVVLSNRGEEAHRAFALPSPGFVRCTGWVPAGDNRLEVAVAMEGGETGEAEIRLRHKQKTTPMRRVILRGGEATWETLRIPLEERTVEGLVTLEMHSLKAPKGARILFGDPRIVLSAPPSRPTPRVRGVVLIVLGSTPAHLLHPYGGAYPVPHIASLASQGIVFEHHRGTSLQARGALTSLLTGRASRGEQEDPLWQSSLTLPEAAQEAHIATAFLTANPHTSRAFGFQRGWETFHAYLPPSQGAPGPLFEEAVQWLEKHRNERFLLLLHTRGGHPPWDISRREANRLPPIHHVGSFDPKFAGRLFAQLHDNIPLAETDLMRAWALHQHALDMHDQALGTFLTALRQIGQEKETAVLITSDLGLNEGAPIPFLEPRTLREQNLSLPLVMKLPAGIGAGKRIPWLSSHADLATTVLSLFGLSPPASFEGFDLVPWITGAQGPNLRPLWAYHREEVSLRRGPFVLSGAGNTWTLCALLQDPLCHHNAHEEAPLTYHNLLRTLRKAEKAQPRKSPPLGHSTPLDQDTEAALRLWGR